MSNQNSQWYVYIIETRNQRLYTGITTNVERRWREHLYSTRGAKFFRTSKPKSIVYVKKVANRSEASRLEVTIKKMKREVKLRLIQSEENELPSVSLQTK